MCCHGLFSRWYFIISFYRFIDKRARSSNPDSTALRSSGGLVGYAIVTFWYECIIPFYLTHIVRAKLESSEWQPSLLDGCCRTRKPADARSSASLQADTAKPQSVLPNSEGSAVDTGAEPATVPDSTP